MPLKHRVGRDRIEDVLLSPVGKELLEPESVERMVRQLQEAFVAQARAREARAVEMTQELQEVQELQACRARLRCRLNAGNPDIGSG